MKKYSRLVIIVFFSLQLQYAFAQTKTNNSKPSAYLLIYFTGISKADEAIRLAVSEDGYACRALNNNKPVITFDTISETAGVRDPHILATHYRFKK